MNMKGSTVSMFIFTK